MVQRLQGAETAEAALDEEDVGFPSSGSGAAGVWQDQLSETGVGGCWSDVEKEIFDYGDGDAEISMGGE